MYNTYDQALAQIIAARRYYWTMNIIANNTNITLLKQIEVKKHIVYSTIRQTTCTN